MPSSIAKIDFSYISCACNRTPHSADWGYNGLICYGASRAVIILDPVACGGGKIIQTLAGHKGRVNASKWVKKTKPFLPEDELVSVSADDCGLIWGKKGDSFLVTGVLKGHSGAVTNVDALYQSRIGSTKLSLVVVTASVDSTVRIWERKSQEGVVCRQVLDLDSGICLSLRLLSSPDDSLLLACGLDDCNVHLYSESQPGTELCLRQWLKGHEDWVTALDITVEDGGDFLLASGSQDATVRLWRFHPPCSHGNDQLFHVEENLVTVGATQLAVGLESVLIGHEGRVYGACWRPPVRTDSGWSQPLELLTASLDKTVVVWSPEGEGEGVWLETARMGEVGGNTLGFYGAVFNPSGTSILAHGYQGGLHMWHKNQVGWRPGVVVGGHFDAVTDLGWEPTLGRYIITVSSDQTTRLHAPWTKNEELSWHEIARPQVHGYDLVCLAMFPDFRFASGADEKVVRAFSAPQNFLQNFKRLCVPSGTKEEEDANSNQILPAGAAVPVLGLSNKAVFQNELERPLEQKHVKDQYDENSYFTPQHFNEPPTEDNLLQNTLWPESMKLYGHGYEVFSLAVTTDGKLLASACKATSEEHAAILLWDTQTWQKVDRLVSHQLTITQMEFSPDNQFLLSVSRDRHWSAFQRTECDSKKYQLVGKSDKLTGIHTRIIWCCSWSHDSLHFATGSRDGKLVLWNRTNENRPALGPFASNSDYIDLPQESFTCVSFGPSFVLAGTEYLIAVGSEVGDITLYGWSETAQSPWRFLFQLSGNSGHQLAVTRLAFRPVQGKAGQTREDSKSDQSTTILQLASCGGDHIVKICDLYINAT